MATIRKNYANTVKKGGSRRRRWTSAWPCITPQLTYDGFDEADIIAEAVFEGMALKKQVFAEIDKIAKPGCILASNTSYLDIDEIASVTWPPGAGASAITTSARRTSCACWKSCAARPPATKLSPLRMALAKQLKKVGVLVGNCARLHRQPHVRPLPARSPVPGGRGRLRRGRRISALYDFGMAMGPLAMGDLAGLDVGWRIRKEFKHLEKPGVRHAAGRRPPVRDGPLRPEDRPRLVACTTRTASPRPIRRSPRSSSSSRARRASSAALSPAKRSSIAASSPWSTKARACSAKASRCAPSDIDMVYLNGYAFPAWRGGPMCYADTVGLKTVLARIEEFRIASRLGPLGAGAASPTIGRERRNVREF